MSKLPKFRLNLVTVAVLSALVPCAMAAIANDAVEVKEAKDAKKWDVNHPPGKAHTVNIDTRTGTLMSVDVSPDGKHLVFDLLGDLYLLPIDGGEAKPLTHSIAWEMQARFSPDGKQLTYMSDAAGGDNIWLMNLDGSGAHALTKESYRLLNNPVWHPNGQYIAARKHFAGTRSLGSGEIWLYHKDGGNGVQLNEKPNWQKDLGEPAFSPDGRYLYYSHDVTPGSSFEYNQDSNGQIYSIFRRDLKEGKTIPFVRGPGGAVRPTPSQDGRYLAFVRRIRNQSSLFIKDLQSGVETPVWRALERDMQEGWAVHGVYPSFAWMPGDKEIVVWAQGKLWRLHLFENGKLAANAKASEIPFHVKHTREIRHALRFEHEVAPDQFDVKQLRWVNVAPKGDKVVYSALGYLYIRDLPNGEARRLTKQLSHFEYHPKFSPDGKQVVFTTWHDDKLGTVRVLDLVSGKETIVSDQAGKFKEPSFSPNGKMVAYSKAAGGFLTTPWHGLNTGVYLANSDGKGKARFITENGSKPQFSNDNDVLYVTRRQYPSEVEEISSLVQIPLGKGDEQVIVKSDTASDFVLSPDGKSLVFNDHFHAYLMPLPLSGKPLNIGKGGENLPQTKLDVNAGLYTHWSGDSRKVYFSLGDELFSRDVEQIRQENRTAAMAKKEAKAAKDSKPVVGYQPTETGQKIGLRVASDKPQAVLALSGAKIISMKGDEVIENGRIVIKDNRIIAIGKASQVAVPAGAQEIDVAGKTIIPGLVDVHWHGAMGEDGIIPQQSWVDYASLAFGVTTLHDPSNNTEQIFTHSEMQRAGKVVAPRIYSTGTILYGAKSSISAQVDSLDDALTHLKRQKAAGAISVKSYNQPRRDQRQQVVEAARLTNMMVVPEGGALFQHNMSMVVDGHTGVEHALPVANVYDDVKQLWSQTQVGYTPTMGVGYGGLDGEHYWYAYSEVWKHPLLSKYVPASVLIPRSVRRLIAPVEDYNVFNIAKAANELTKVGVKVNLGAHGQREGLAAHWEMWTAVKGGMTPMQAIRMGTINGAHYLGLQRDIGSLEVGKLADLVVIDGDVLQDISHSDKVSHVMLNGRLYESNSMNMIAPQRKARKPFFFEGKQAENMPVGYSDDGGEAGHGHGHGHGHGD